MDLWKKFKPEWMVESIYNITPDELKKLGYKGVLADLDNTLIAWNVKESSHDAIDWIGSLKDAGLPVVVISNNFPKRVGPVAESLNVPFIGNSLKPSTAGYNRALELIGLEKDDVVMVGDQILTDILGANLCDIDSILVKPLINTDAGVTLFNRQVERFILKQLRKNDDQLEWRRSLSEPIDK